jgi:beta-glucosidase
LCAHGAAVQAYRASGHSGQIGLVVNLEPKHAASDSPEDLAATRRAHTYMNEQFLDPVFLGRYPVGLREVFGEAWPEFPADEMKLIQEPIDFVGLNWYTRSVTRHDPLFPPVCASAVKVPHHTYTETGWEVHAPSLTETLCWMKERYGSFPVYITENGAAFYDAPKAVNGEVHDPLRVQYYRDHLAACEEAIRQGVDLRGYFAWSLFDNFEWASGFAKRFGLVHVDFETQQRTLKASALQYREIIRTNGAVLHGVTGAPTK